VGTPLELALISILGNVYTSTTLAGLFIESIWFAVGLFVVYMAVLRWLALSRRKLELKILLQKREAQRAEKEAGTQDAADSEPPVATAEPLDFDAVDQQSRKLLRLGLVLIAAIAAWQIWSEVLPAFTLLEGFSLWSKTALVDGVEIVQPVTLLDLLLALLVVLVSLVASRNLPGFVEIAIPQRLNVEPGSRYAIITLIRYFIIMVGAIVVLNIVGWDWSQIQWLVAALTVGLGFGLQEIVANFVSGIVILFERPVRVGDTVTVGQLSGTVSRIRIRGLGP
jgi:potassium efflux system protein